MKQALPAISGLLLRVMAWLMLSWAILAPATALGDEPAPLLMLETGMHSARLNDIATDPQGRWLVSVSSDRTARVWSLADGKLLSILRPPVGPGLEGVLMTVALSPDGSLIAVAGITGATLTASKTYAVYLYDRASGRMQGVLRDFPANITALAISPDGRQLAVGLYGRAGIQLIDLESRRRIGVDRAYREEVTGLDFSQDGSRLMAGSRDGEIHSYAVTGRDMTLVQRRSTPTGKPLRRIKLSPDGKLLAMGHFDSTQIVVLNTADLSVAWLPEKSGTDTGSRDGNYLGCVAWSPDGRQLYAGGRWSRDRKFQVRRWEDAGQGRSTDIPVLGNTIVQLLTTSDGRLIVGSLEPSWAVVSPQGQVVMRQASPLADLRFAGLQVSRDARQVGFSFSFDGEPAVFDLSSGLLLTDVPGLPPARRRTEGLVLENYDNDSHPILNNISLQLYGRDMARRGAVSEDGTLAAIGGESNVYLFDRNGKRLWGRPSYGTTWGVALSSDGRWLVAAYADGTIRWHRTSDGSETLRLFAHADRKRWVMWTPAGFFKASVGGEDLFGWALNRGNDASADFLPASRFRDTFSRADIVNKALAGEGADGTAPTRLADIAPPAVSIDSHGSEVETNAALVRVRVTTRTLGAVSSTILKARVNGEAVELRNPQLVSTPGIDLTREIVREFDVSVPPQDSTIAVFAENANGVSSPALLQVRRKGAPQDDEPIARPRLYILAIGISAYAQRDMKLAFAAKDARDFVTALSRGGKQLYRDVVVRTLTDAKADRDGIMDGLEWLRRQATHRDVVVLFFAGHGVNDADGTYYFLPYGGDPERLKRTGIIDRELRNTLTSLPGKALLFVDTCHAGNVLGTGRRDAAGEMSGMINELASAENGVLVFSASTSRQYSLENPAWGNGAFTKALVEGLQGAADLQKTGRITHKMLDFYVSERVKTLTNGKQTTVTIIPQGVPDFPIALSARGK